MIQITWKHFRWALNENILRYLQFDINNKIASEHIDGRYELFQNAFVMYSFISSQIYEDRTGGIPMQ